MIGQLITRLCNFVSVHLFIALRVVIDPGKTVKFTADSFQQTPHPLILCKFHKQSYSNKVVELIKYMASVDHAE